MNEVYAVLSVVCGLGVAGSIGAMLVIARRPTPPRSNVRTDLDVEPQR